MGWAGGWWQQGLLVYAVPYLEAEGKVGSRKGALGEGGGEQLLGAPDL